MMIWAQVLCTFCDKMKQVLFLIILMFYQASALLFLSFVTSVPTFFFF